MPDKKVVPVRFYAKTDMDLIEWLEGLAAGQGNDTIKAMLRAGIAAPQNSNGHSNQSISGALVATLDSASLEAALEGFLPRLREVVDAAFASANFTRAGTEATVHDENTASADLLKGHFISADEDD